MKSFKAVLVLCLLFLIACEQSTDETIGPVYQKKPSLEIPVYYFAIHPLHNPAKLSEAYQPLIDYLNQHISEVRFELEASRDYQSFEVKFRKRKPEILLPNPWQTLEALKVGYHVIAMAGDAEDFKGIFIVRKDNQLTTPSDLKGKVVSYPSPTALAAAIMPQRFLYENGIDINKDIKNRYVGSQESSIMNVFLGEAVVGATWPPPWRSFQKDHPDEAAQLTVIWETPSLINNSVMVRDDVPQNIVHRIKNILLNLHEHQAGQTILKGMETARFYLANDQHYDRVRQFIVDFEQDIRPVETH